MIDDLIILRLICDLHLSVNCLWDKNVSNTKMELKLSSIHAKMFVYLVYELDHLLYSMEDFGDLIDILVDM